MKTSPHSALIMDCVQKRSVEGMLYIAFMTGTEIKEYDDFSNGEPCASLSRISESHPTDGRKYLLDTQEPRFYTYFIKSYVLFNKIGLKFRTEDYGTGMKHL